MAADIIDFIEHLKKRASNPNATISLQDIKAFSNLEDKDVAWISSIFSFARYSLFLKSLFFRNHKDEFGSNINPNTGFMVGYKEDHLEKMNEICCKTLSSMDRQYRKSDARGKTYIEIVQEITGFHASSNSMAYNYIKELLYDTDNVIVVLGISNSKINSKGGYLRDWIKALDDAHIRNVHPKSDLIIIDYAKFLQLVWGEIGYYLSILTYSEEEREYID